MKQNNLTMISSTIIILLLCVQAVHTSQYLDGVIVLNQDNFEDSLDKFSNLLIYFEAQDCQYCQEFKITYVMIAQYFSRLHRQDSNTNQQKQLQSNSYPRLQVQFAKLKLSPETQHIFKKYQIFQAPTIKIVKQGIMDPKTQFENLDYSDSIIEQFSTWLERYFSQTLPQIDSADEQIPSQGKSFLVSCGSPADKFLHKVSLQKLQHNFYCTQRHSEEDLSHNVKVYQNGDFVDFINLTTSSSMPTADNSDYSSQERVYRDNMNRYFYQQPIYWDLKAVHSTFVSNQSSFLFIMNNETKSYAAYGSYKKIKQQWNSNYFFPPTVFYVSDLSLTPQQTTKIKKFVFGSEICTSRVYPYPVLAYLKSVNDRVTKYWFPMKAKMNEENLKYWMENVVKKVQMGLPIDDDDVKQKQTKKQQQQKQTEEKNYQDQQANLQQQEETSKELSTQQQKLKYRQKKLKVKQNFVEFPEIAFNKHEILTKQDYEPNFNLKAVSYTDMTRLLSLQYPHQFFVFFSWRNELSCSHIQQGFKKWWTYEEQQERLEKERKKNQQEDKLIADQDKPGHQEKEETNDQEISYNIYANKTNVWMLNLNFNDYPPNFTDANGKVHQLKIQSIPSIAYFSKGKTEMIIKEGLIDKADMQQFVMKHTKFDENTVKVETEIQEQTTKRIVEEDKEKEADKETTETEQTKQKSSNQAAPTIVDDTTTITIQNIDKKVQQNKLIEVIKENDNNDDVVSERDPIVAKNDNEAEKTDDVNQQKVKVEQQQNHIISTINSANGQKKQRPSIHVVDKVNDKLLDNEKQDDKSVVFDNNKRNRLIQNNQEGQIKNDNQIITEEEGQDKNEQQNVIKNDDDGDGDETGNKVENKNNNNNNDNDNKQNNQKIRKSKQQLQQQIVSTQLPDQNKENKKQRKQNQKATETTTTTTTTTYQIKEQTIQQQDKDTPKTTSTEEAQEKTSAKAINPETNKKFETE